MFGPWGPGGAGWVWSLVVAGFWIALVVAAVVLLRREIPHIRTSRRSPSLDLLEQRYARGEIDRGEFLERRAVLLQQPPAESQPQYAPPPPPVPEPAPPPPDAPTQRGPEEPPPTAPIQPPPTPF